MRKAASKNFLWSELQCPCIECNHIRNVSGRAIRALQELRDIIGAPLHINSGARCRAHNEAVGGTRNSMHLSLTTAASCAFDISLFHNDVKYDIDELFDNALTVGFTGIGLYHTFIHVDTRGPVVLWDNRT